MKKTLFFLFLLIVTFNISAQNNDILVNISYDAVEDSVFFAKMNKKFAEIRKERPTVALVLAGGGAKGTAHIGVLKYIEEKGIPIDFVAGTSMGALVGGLYSMGYSAFEIDSIVKNIDWNVMMSDNIPMEYYSYKRNSHKRTYILDIPFSGLTFLKSLPSGFLYGLNVYNLLSRLSVGYQNDIDFTELPTPFCCVATEIVTQTEKHWTSGSIIDAMRSTMSIPGYFRPVRVDSMILSDGGTKNNFPTDIAKAAGADIIIGVEISMPRDYSDVNNIADILVQTTKYSGSLEAHKQNVKNSTIYITPDISGYNSLSFGSNEVATLIDRGYAEAIKHSAELDALVDIVGNSGRQLHNKKAIDISKTSVKINSVEVDGVNDKEKKYIDQKLRLKSGTYYDMEEFEIDHSIIYGTMAFSDVTFRLLNDTAGGYKLKFLCNKRPTNSLSFGVRLDTEEWFAALLNFGIGKNKIYGSELDVTARLSMSPYLKLEWSYMPIKGPKFGASLLVNYMTLYGTNSQSFSRSYYEQYLRNALNIYISGTRWSRVYLNGGFRLDQLPFLRSLSEQGISQSVKWNSFHPFLYLRFVFDMEDNHYFPTKGLRTYADYDYDFRRTHFVALGVRGTIPICDFLHIIPSLQGRYIFGDENKYEYMNNYVGGIMPGRHYEHQIPFIGFNGEMKCLDFLTVVDLNFRFKIWKNMYFSAIADAMHDGNMSGMRDHAVFSAAIQYGYKTKIGPFFVNLHWNNFYNNVGFYLGFGHDF